MNRLVKLGMVTGGYVAACLMAGVVVTVYQRLTQDSTSQASAGMYAFGDFLLFLGLFGILALFPTGLAIYFLVRRFRAR